MKYNLRRVNLLSGIAFAAMLAAPALYAEDAIRAPAPYGSMGPECAAAIGTLGLSPEQDGVIGAALRDEAKHEANAKQSAYRHIRETLTEAQRAQYDSLIQQQLDRRLVQMTAALDLTPAQQSQLKAVLTLADPRFTPSIAGADLAEAIGFVLSEDQARKLAASIPGCSMVSLAGL